MQLSEAVVHHAKGNPLVLSSLGYHLHRKDIRVWEDKLAKLKHDLDKDILEVFTMNYDDLEDTEKNAFLDIACFFGRCNKDLFQQTLYLRCFYAKWAISRLIDRCFINISNKDIRVHELLQKVGRGIVCNESFDDPWKRTRLWDPDEIYRVLTHYKGPKEVQAISLDLSKIREMTLSCKAFKRVQDKLRLLKFYYPRRIPRECQIFHRLAVQMTQIKIHLPEQGLKYLSKDLRILRWDHYTYKSLPSNLCLGKLIELRMPCSHLEELVWNGFQPPVNLKILDLSNSVDLARVTDLSEVTNLEVLDLSSCGKLKNVPSLEYCSKLTKIDLSFCDNLCRVPKIPKNVEELSLRGTVIEKVPKSICEHLRQLVKLDLSDCKCLRRLPSSIKNCKCLVELNLRRSQLVKLPDSIGELDCLQYLDLEGCILSEIPHSIGSLMSLRKLNLTGNIFKSIPASIKQLSELTDLILNGCVILQCLPELPSCLQHLTVQCCTSLESVQSIYTEVQKEYEASFEIFNFAYCNQLNEDAYHKIMGDAWLRIQRMATSLFNQGFQSRARFCVPGSEVPEWFSYQNKRGSSLQAIKPPHRNITESLGCAFCVVVASKEEIDHEDFAAPDEENFDTWIGFDDIRCECKFITMNGHQSDLHFSYMLHMIDDVGKIGSNHVFVWYDPSPKSGYCFNEATFEFCLDYKHGTPRTCEVIKCGVHLLFAKDDNHEQPRPNKRSKMNIVDPDLPLSSCLTGQLNAPDGLPLP
ncbi:unnamed protein product [Dovyalis caffra]|uniref:Uncharacterized protein n=1 Tax=Dovyalis caffra TaxID=77055 RepID=A0AAV1RE83_9ROSI|nr:unnamed protein product [Dovyalis caffra]